MPRKKDGVKGGAPSPVIRENSRLMRTHESMVDYINGRTSAGSFLDVLAPALFGLNFLKPLEDDLIYSDEDDDYDDDDDEEEDNDDDRYYRPSRAAHRTLEPHPQIKQLTDEEADKIAKELIEEEERRKEKTRKNKRKKMRKKEKKRLEKENALKENLHEEEQAKSDSSDNPKETAIIESNAEADESSQCGESQNAVEATGRDEQSNNAEEKILVTVNKKEDEEQKEEDLNNSCAASAKSAPAETCNQNPTKETKREKSKLPEVRQPEEKKTEVAEKPEVRKKTEEKPETKEEKTVDPVVDEYAKRSIELANMGNRLAASGQFEMAVRFFTDAIKHNPKEFKLFGNRSLCYERLQQHENALRDADLALSMEPNWIKGLFRKGKALCGLKRYYEASLIYKEVLKLESTSAEAAQELKRAQTLHLMEMGFTWAQSSEALKTHASLEEAVEALFAGDGTQSPGGAGARRDNADPPVVQEHYDEGEWIVQQTSRPRTQHVRESEASDHSRAKSHSPTPPSRNPVKPNLFPVWVGFLAPAMTYVKLHELFSRAGTVYSIKMLLEHQCAFVNYTRKEDCERAIQCINGMVFDGSPLTVRYPYKIHTGLGVSKTAATDNSSRPGMFKKRECFFWRTTGCTRQDCIYKHIPEHKNIDRDKFTNRLGYMSHAGNQK
ncbi:myosin-11 [Stegastes partitus]|uniref:Myosin-11-like n=1 Tax=Stegastes partitus TaxID=144197 RepID=A0A3B5BAH6_9TELE|nr:PREDICTED: myosin-11-like [Stegastes partitus]